mmetsp:Transcript_85874/g.135600  ORF Transcript_85874/g.135600 Transcript_85874/m.135600 type:complete len:152 (-) Transcript_85874:55-510(-)
MDYSTVVLIGVGILYLAGRMFRAHNKIEEIRAHLPEHLHEKVFGKKAGLFAFLDVLDPSLRIGLCLGLLMALSSFLSSETQHMLRLDGWLGQGLSVSSRWSVMLGLFRTVKKLPMKNWFGSFGKTPEVERTAEKPKSEKPRQTSKKARRCD